MLALSSGGEELMWLNGFLLIGFIGYLDRVNQLWWVIDQWSSVVVGVVK